MEQLRSEDMVRTGDAVRAKWGLVLALVALWACARQPEHTRASGSAPAKAAGAEEAEVRAEPSFGVFRGFPGAHRLCEGHTLGFSGAQQVEIGFTLYASSREPSEVTRFYAEAYQLPWKPDQTTLRVRPGDGPAALSVHPVSSDYPGCGVRPESGDRTIIVVSGMGVTKP